MWKVDVTQNDAEQFEDIDALLKDSPSDAIAEAADGCKTVPFAARQLDRCR